jgi:ABC-type bacteriocin/lantibiotic exporter with double-glycine peptidase domain
MTLADLHREKPLGVLHVDSTHFVALVGYQGDSAQIIDPLYREAVHPVRWLLDDLDARWDGAILVVQPKRQR